MIQGDPNGPVVTLSNNTAACTLAGLTLRTGSIGISGTITQATIRNCRIMDNISHGVDLHGASPTLSHCLITSNGGNGLNMQTTRTGTGRQAQTISCQPVIENCIIVDNSGTAIDGGEPIIIKSIKD
jgi:nitrous oxidase accessory protein NosD